MLKRLTNGEFVLAMLAASIFWIAVLAWATSYAPTDPEKEACYHAAEKSSRSTEQCKSFWEKTTSDPVAMFTLVLAVSTVGLWSATSSFIARAKSKLALAVRSPMSPKNSWQSSACKLTFSESSMPSDGCSSLPLTSRCLGSNIQTAVGRNRAHSNCLHCSQRGHWYREVAG